MKLKKNESNEKLARVVLESVQSDALPKSMQTVQRTLYRAGYRVPLSNVYAQLLILEKQGVLEKLVVEGSSKLLFLPRSIAVPTEQGNQKQENNCSESMYDIKQPA